MLKGDKMIKTKAAMEIEIAGKIYEFYFDADSPAGCIHDALMKMKGIVVDKMSQAHKEEEEAVEKLSSIETEKE